MNELDYVHAQTIAGQERERADTIQAGLLLIAAALVLFMLCAYMFGRSEPGKAFHDTGDYCPAGTYPGVVCENDWPCSIIPARLEDGECWR